MASPEARGEQMQICENTSSTACAVPLPLEGKA